MGRHKWVLMQAIYYGEGRDTFMVFMAMSSQA